MKGRPSADFTRCPRCKRRTVLFRLAPRGEDFYSCTRRGCDWSTYADPEYWDRQGHADLAAWRTLNGCAATLTPAEIAALSDDLVIEHLIVALRFGNDAEAAALSAEVDTRGLHAQALARAAAVIAADRRRLG